MQGRCTCLWQKPCRFEEARSRRRRCGLCSVRAQRASRIFSIKVRTCGLKCEMIYTFCRFPYDKRTANILLYRHIHRISLPFFCQCFFSPRSYYRFFYWSICLIILHDTYQFYYFKESIMEPFSHLWLTSSCHRMTTLTLNVQFCFSYLCQ